MGGGAVALASSGVVGYFAQHDNSGVHSVVFEGAQNANLAGLRSQVATEAWSSTALLAAGVIAAGAGVALYFFGGSDDSKQASITVTSHSAELALRF
jgi:hypothetical protein